MKTLRPRVWSGRGAAAFSLVEIALALGIVGFALVGIVGALPVAMNNERLSVAQTRAASLANTLFANFRAQPFDIVQYVDGGVNDAAPTVVGASGTLNLNTKTSNIGDNVTIYAYFDETAASALAGDERRLHFQSTIPTTGGLYYTIVLRFDNNPTPSPSAANPSPAPLFLPPYVAAPGGAMHAQANAVEASITEAGRPRDVFHFNTVIANRSE